MVSAVHTQAIWIPTRQRVKVSLTFPIDGVSQSNIQMMTFDEYRQFVSNVADGIIEIGGIHVSLKGTDSIMPESALQGLYDYYKKVLDGIEYSFGER